MENLEVIEIPSDRFAELGLMPPPTREMMALSVRPPWAYTIIYGMPVYKAVSDGKGISHIENDERRLFKNIENRTWPLPKKFQLPQRVVIHVGTREDNEALDWMLKIGLSPAASMLMHSKLLPRGAFLGEVDVIDCVTKSKNPWFMGPYGFVLANPMPYAKPIPAKGKLGFFTANISTPEQKDA